MTYYEWGYYLVFIYLSAFFLIVGSWAWFIHIKEKEKPYSLLVLVSLASPFLLFSVAIKLAEYTGSNSGVFVSIFLLMILFANSIMLNLTIILVSLKNKGRSTIK